MFQKKEKGEFWRKILLSDMGMSAFFDSEQLMDVCVPSWTP